MIEFKNVTFTYEDATTPSIKNVDLTISKGEVVCLTGASGCGKTTFTRLVSGLIPHFFNGTLEGEVLVNGESVKESDIYEWSQHMGSVFQNPRGQFFCLNTTSELAFELENYAVAPDAITQKIDDGLALFKLEHLIDRDIFQLSGGEKQLIACVAVSICDHDLIILDEPSSNLDFTTLHKLSEMIRQWREDGKTVIIAEHRLHYLTSFADRFIIFKHGTIEAVHTQSEFKALSNHVLTDKGLRATNLHALQTKQDVDSVYDTEKIRLHDFKHKYHKHASYALNIDTQYLQKGEVTAMIGHNGAGKSTFARCLTGLERKFKGHISDPSKTWKNKDLIDQVYMVFQDVNAQLFTESVEEEIRLSQPTLTEAEIHKIAHTLDIADAYLERHPLSLSGGEMQRLAIASAIAANRKILIFDEPTSGLDGAHMREVAQLLNTLAQRGHTILVISHDYELVLACADNIFHMEGGMCEAHYRLNTATLPRLQAFFDVVS